MLNIRSSDNQVAEVYFIDRVAMTPIVPPARSACVALELGSRERTTTTASADDRSVLRDLWVSRGIACVHSGGARRANQRMKDPPEATYASPERKCQDAFTRGKSVQF